MLINSNNNRPSNADTATTDGKIVHHVKGYIYAILQQLRPMKIR